jgi:CRISPR/Cas system-associated protein Csx1
MTIDVCTGYQRCLERSIWAMMSKVMTTDRIEAIEELIGRPLKEYELQMIIAGIVAHSQQNIQPMQFEYKPLLLDEAWKEKRFPVDVSLQGYNSTVILIDEGLN